jgi:hypothetical protein
MTYLCKTCKEHKPFTDFHKNKYTKTGYEYHCKQCESIKKKSLYHITKAGRDIKAELNKTLPIDINTTLVCTGCKQEKNILEFSVNNKSATGRVHQCKECTNTRMNSLKEKTQRNKGRRERLSSDINFKLACIMRTRLYIALKKNSKKGSSVKLLGCSIDYFKQYIESQFLDDMSWDNWGSVWHLDHILPMRCFDLTNLDELSKVCHHTNMQPLYASLNQEKSDQIVDEDWYIQRGVNRKSPTIS